MINLLPGIKKFSKEVYPQQKKLFDELAKGQKPHTLFITCSDSRIDPSLITQTNPGELFIIRNAGNIVPPFGSSKGGEEASIEFAIEGLGVKNIIICGHSQCGAMAGLSGKADVEKLCSTKVWLDHARATKKRMSYEGCEELARYVEDNVLVQVQNLKTHDSVSAALASKKVHIFGWVYKFEEGKIFIYQNEKKKFIDAEEINNEHDQNIDHFAI